MSRLLTHGDLPADTIVNIDTDASGSDYVALPSLPGARIVRIVNPETDIEVRQVGGTATVIAPAEVETTIFVGNDAAELELRRADESATPATVRLLVGVYA